VTVKILTGYMKKGKQVNLLYYKYNFCCCTKDDRYL